MKLERKIGLLASFVSCAASGHAAAAVVDAVEYYHAGFGHYFLTASPEEAAAIDAGTIKGWARTGNSFKVQGLATGGYSAVCRFFSTSFSPQSSHFYTPSATECGSVKQNPNWQFEGNAFYVQSAATDGSCPANNNKVYRLYNNGQGGAPNHRYTDSLTVRSQMIGQGWIPEGAGTDGAAFCSEKTGGSGTSDPALALQNAQKMLSGTWDFSYTNNGSFQNDAFSFTKVVSDPASADASPYAQGTNQYGLPVTARYNAQTAKMEIRSSFAIPATDYFTFTGGDVVGGCYYFLPTNTTTPTKPCIVFSGIRR